MKQHMSPTRVQKAIVTRCTATDRAIHIVYIRNHGASVVQLLRHDLVHLLLHQRHFEAEILLSSRLCLCPTTNP